MKGMKGMRVSKQMRAFEKRIFLFLLFYVLILGCTVKAEPVILKGPAISPVNGNTYCLLSSSNWVEAEVKAVELGGHLATVRNEDEQVWLCSDFVGTEFNLSGYLMMQQRNPFMHHRLKKPKRKVNPTVRIAPLGMMPTGAKSGNYLKWTLTT